MGFKSLQALPDVLMCKVVLVGVVFENLVEDGGLSPSSPFLHSFSCK